jgi:cytochrome P450
LRCRLRREPKTIPLAVDEFLRFYSPITIGRLVLKDTTLSGVTMKRGQYVMLMLPIGNRDPRAFPYPDTFIADRSPNKHLALGIGIHRCLGAHILRVELQVVIEEFLKRIPDFELDRSNKAVWMSAQVSGMRRVPIVFEPGKRAGTRLPGVFRPG